MRPTEFMGATVNTTVCKPRLANPARWQPLGETVISRAMTPSPALPAAPATNDSRPQRATAQLLTLLRAALAENAKLPSGVTEIQQATPWPLASEGVARMSGRRACRWASAMTANTGPNLTSVVTPGVLRSGPTRG